MNSTTIYQKNCKMFLDPNHVDKETTRLMNMMFCKWSNFKKSLKIYQTWEPVTWPQLEGWYASKFMIFEVLWWYFFVKSFLFFYLSSYCCRHQKLDYKCSGFPGTEAQRTDCCHFYWFLTFVEMFFLVLKKWQDQSSSRITMMAIIKAIMKIYITYNVIIYLYNSSISIYFYMPSQQQALDSLNYFERVFRTITNLLGYSVSLFCFILLNPIYMIVWLSPFSCTSS